MPEHQKSSRGGAGRGQGRKPASPNGKKMKPRAIRMTDDEWAKCLRLGGSEWIRRKIKQAKDGG